MEAKDAIKRIREFGLHHAIEDLPKSRNTVEAFNEAIELLRMEEQGLLIKLPCKVDEYVYKIITQHSNYDDTPYKIVSTVCFRLDMIYEIGKTVFLTREEAELKLKEIQNEPM